MEVRLPANRGAGLPPRFAVMVRRTGQCFGGACSAGAPMRRTRVVSPGRLTVNSCSDLSKTNFSDKNATIFAESMGTRVIEVLSRLSQLLRFGEG